MKRSLVLVAMLVSCCWAATYQTGKLVSVTDSRSNRDVGNSYTGAVTTVTDVEYRLSVELGDMIYVGSYWPRWNWSYAPTDFVVNDSVQVRIDGKHMLIRRANGKELRTQIIQRVHKPN